MGKKRKQTKSNRPAQTQSYQQQIAGQTLEKFKPYIDSQLQGAARAIAMQQSELVQNAFMRIRILEELLMSKFEDITKDTLTSKVAELEDAKNGLIVADEVASGDTIRLEIKAKEEGQEYQGGTKLLVNNVGTGQTLGEVLEEALLGMKTDEVKEVVYGKDVKMTAELTVNRISRLQVVEEAVVASQLETEEVLEEKSDENPDAGQ